MDRQQPPEHDTRPRSVEEWIDQVNHAEQQPTRPEGEPPLPSGWWILPGLMLGALLWVGVFFAGRASAPALAVESHQGAQGCPGERD